MGHEVSSEPGDLAADARSFTGEDGDLVFGDGLCRINLASGANTFYPFDVESEIWAAIAASHYLVWMCDG